jgi:hypothetical protein
VNTPLAEDVEKIGSEELTNPPLWCLDTYNPPLSPKLLGVTIDPILSIPENPSRHSSLRPMCKSGVFTQRNTTPLLRQLQG